ncbi:MAG: HIT family protein [Thiobacillaceae bacterium]
MTDAHACPLCIGSGGDLLRDDGWCRIVLADEPDYPGVCRVILNRHISEMTDLAPDERTRLMDAVWETERAVRAVMRPDKVNLASLGNIVPHLHWHVIPRYADDAHFPNPIWGEAKRSTRTQPDLCRVREALRNILSEKII